MFGIIIAGHSGPSDSCDCCRFRPAAKENEWIIVIMPISVFSCFHGVFSELGCGEGGSLLEMVGSTSVKSWTTHRDL